MMQTQSNNDPEWCLNGVYADPNQAARDCSLTVNKSSDEMSDSVSTVESQVFVALLFELFLLLFIYLLYCDAKKCIHSCNLS